MPRIGKPFPPVCRTPARRCRLPTITRNAFTPDRTDYERARGYRDDAVRFPFHGPAAPFCQSSHRHPRPRSLPRSRCWSRPTPLGIRSPLSARCRAGSPLPSRKGWLRAQSARAPHASRSQSSARTGTCARRLRRRGRTRCPDRNTRAPAARVTSSKAVRSFRRRPRTSSRPRPLFAKDHGGSRSAARCVCPATPDPGTPLMPPPIYDARRYDPPAGLPLAKSKGREAPRAIRMIAAPMSSSHGGPSNVVVVGGWW